MYSQNDEEKTIGDLFGGHIGKFIDIGAFDGVQFSNTRALAEKGWGGVLVEPSPSSFPALEKAYAGNLLVTTVNAALSSDIGGVKFYDNGCISTTSKKFRDEYPNEKFEEITVPTITWGALFGRFGLDFDFVNIDTEGTNLDVLKLFPFNRVKPRCICIEHERVRVKEILDVFKMNGYREHNRTGENIIAVRS
jgi:FkbM family methyltransferase